MTQQRVLAPTSSFTRTRIWAASVRFELAQQARDPLTTLYPLVFFLLAFGYTASDVVELVNERGATPRNAHWALVLAYSGLAAFGQVITTMITATAVLRDSATRALPLVATSSLSPRVWLLARATAAVVITAVVYLAIPLGAMLGSRFGDGLIPVAASDTVPWYFVPYFLVTLPTMVTVAAILISVGALARRALPVLAAALVLVLLWQTALSLTASPGTVTLAAWLDPFANAPVLVATGAWSDADRATRHVALDSLILGNRVLWLAIAASVFSVALWRVRWPEPSGEKRKQPGSVSSPESYAAQSAFASLRGATTAWITTDGGWRVVTVLALLNAATSAWTRAAGDSALPALLAAVSAGSRLFVILLATVYAGELLWREQELRVASLVDTSPVPTSTIALARLSGLAIAQLQVAGAIIIAAIAVALLRDALAVRAAPVVAAWAVFVVWLPFVQLTALSLAVHVLVRHKVLAHLLLITGWTLAVTLDQHGAASAWYRFGEPAPLLTGAGAIAWGPLALRAGYWTIVSGALVMFTVWRWPRGESTRAASTGPRLAVPPTSRR